MGNRIVPGNLILKKIMRMSDGLLLIRGKFRIAGFFVAYMIINGVTGHEVLIRPPIATECGCLRAARPPGEHTMVFKFKS